MKPYVTLAARGQDEFIINKSRFIGIGVPVGSEEEALLALKGIKEKYPGANHHCYAYIVGANSGIMRYSDDGEPGGTAGLPIIEVMKVRQVTNALVVVVRFFGGILLGAGGLVRAYAQGAKTALASAGVCRMEPTRRFLIEVGYAQFDRLEYFLKSQPVIIEDKAFSDVIILTLIVKTVDADAFCAALTAAMDGGTEPLLFGEEHAAWPEN